MDEKKPKKKELQEAIAAEIITFLEENKKIIVDRARKKLRKSS